MPVGFPHPSHPLISNKKGTLSKQGLTPGYISVQYAIRDIVNDAIFFCTPPNSGCYFRLTVRRDWGRKRRGKPLGRNSTNFRVIYVGNNPLISLKCKPITYVLSHGRIQPRRSSQPGETFLYFQNFGGAQLLLPVHGRHFGLKTFCLRTAPRTGSSPPPARHLPDCERTSERNCSKRPVSSWFQCSSSLEDKRGDSLRRQI